jgi:ATP-dependent Lon protease
MEHSPFRVAPHEPERVLSSFLKNEDKLMILQIPVMIMRGVTVFPGTNLNFETDDPLASASLNAAMRGKGRRIFLITQKMTEDEELPLYPEEGELYRIGVLATVKQLLRTEESSTALVEGNKRAHLLRIVKTKPVYVAEIEVLEEVEDFVENQLDSAAILKQTAALTQRYVTVAQGNAPDFTDTIKELNHPGKTADFLAQNVFMPPEKRQDILETFDPVLRLMKMNNLLLEAIGFLEVDFQVRMATNQRLEEGQREMVLREQLKVIRRSLGEENLDDSAEDAEMYRDKILALALDRDIERKLLKEADKLKKQHPGSMDANVVTQYLDACLSLPWTIKTEELTDAVHTREILDADHYGLEKVKERITEFVAVRQMNPNAKGGILCLVGPPGTGKTSIASGVAKALNRKMSRISLGGVHDEADIRGHRKTYVGAMPGRIIEAVIRAGTRNPLILLDEVDKIGHDYRGDPAAALLEALDPEQNVSFRDHYLEIPFDLSETLFITTANDKGGIPAPLLDRMEVIEIPSYTDEEKLLIAKTHLLAKQRKKHGLKASQFHVSDDALRVIIADYTRESGVRKLERELATLCRKSAVLLAKQLPTTDTLPKSPQPILPRTKTKDRAAYGTKSVSVKTANLETFLGPKQYKRNMQTLKPAVGLVHGLAWTSVGGEVLDVEVNVMDGNGKLELTGNLGDVMKESARAGFSYIRSKAKELGVDPKFYKNRDIHIHFPEGATPKDGPSAGVAVTLGLVSALTNRPVRGDVAMTGEITLRGRVLPIGGLREKTMAALRADIHTVIIPQGNEADVAEIDPLVRDALSFVTVESMDAVLNTAFSD